MHLLSLIRHFFAFDTPQHLLNVKVMVLRETDTLRRHIMKLAKNSCDIYDLIIFQNIYIAATHNPLFDLSAIY
jgi:hypothetical protein